MVRERESPGCLKIISLHRITESQRLEGTPGDRLVQSHCYSIFPRVGYTGGPGGHRISPEETPPPPWAAVPLHHHSFWEEIFPNIQPEPPRAQLEVIPSCPKSSLNLVLSLISFSAILNWGKSVTRGAFIGSALVKMYLKAFCSHPYGYELTCVLGAKTLTGSTHKRVASEIPLFSTLKTTLE